MHRKILDLPVHSTTFKNAIKTIVEWIHTNEKRYVSTCTVYTIMRGLDDERIFQALFEADMRTADGMPLVWWQKLRGITEAERVYGPDIMLALCEITAYNSDISHYLIGGLPGVPEKLTDALQARFPGLTIAGMYSPPVVDVVDTPDPDVVKRLNESDATIIWVGLGSPKQDLWMHVYRPVLDAPLLIGVGAAFDFISGEKSQAPLWMRNSGLEWFFRLVQEPRRLWKRYTVYNLRFLYIVMLLYFERRFRS